MFRNKNTEKIIIKSNLSNFLLILRDILRDSEEFSPFFNLWKKVGYRITDEDYVSSKQQVKKKNPKDEDLLEIFCVESSIALILWCLTLIKTKQHKNSDFKDLNSIVEILEKEKKFDFIFNYEIFNFWELILNTRQVASFNSIISDEFPKILKFLETMSIKEIFLNLHQTILDSKSRKIYGEFYTPPNLSDIIVNRTYHFSKSYNKIIDLSCGSGILLLDFSELLLKKQKQQNNNTLIGIDISPIATLITKFALFFSDQKINDRKSSSSDPLIFCADSLISYSQIDGLLNNDKNSSSLDSYLQGNKEKCIYIDFLGKKYEILIKNFRNRGLNGFRDFCGKNIDLALRNQKSEIKLSNELIDIIKKSIFSRYLKNLVSDRICAIYSLTKKYDIILGNPPYMRLQTIHPIWKREIYTKTFDSAKGHFDIYYLFIELGCKIIEENGTLGYITSNKFVNTSSAAEIRKIISKQMTIRSLINFDDSHVFDALVLPMIFILTKGKENESYIYTSLKKIKSEISEEHDINELTKILDSNEKNLSINNKVWKIEEKMVKLSRFLMEQPLIDIDNWIFISKELRKIIEEIEKNSKCKLNDVCEKIIVGIKTTANYAFIDYSNKFINKEEIKKEREFIKSKYNRDLFFPFVKGRYIRDYSINFKSENNDIKSYIFYPHYKDKKENIMKAYPEVDIKRMISFLKEKGFAKKLKKREYVKKANRFWYEIWNHKNIDDLERPKIVVPDISPKNNFAIDYNGNYIGGTAYFAILKNSSVNNLRFILAILNSSLSEFYHKITSGNKLYARRYRYWSSNIKYLPIIPIESATEDLKNRIIEKIALIEKNFNLKLKYEIDEMIFDLFNINNSSREIIQKWVIDNNNGK